MHAPCAHSRVLEMLVCTDARTRGVQATPPGIARWTQSALTLSGGGGPPSTCAGGMRLVVIAVCRCRRGGCLAPRLLLPLLCPLGGHHRGPSHWVGSLCAGPLLGAAAGEDQHGGSAVLGEGRGAEGEGGQGAGEGRSGGAGGTGGPRTAAAPPRLLIALLGRFTPAFATSPGLCRRRRHAACTPSFTLVF